MSCGLRNKNSGTGTKRAATNELVDARFRFDPQAWDQMLKEQRMLIAAAAGVDPSKVRIQLGH